MTRRKRIGGDAHKPGDQSTNWTTQSGYMNRGRTALLLSGCATLVLLSCHKHLETSVKTEEHLIVDEHATEAKETDTQTTATKEEGPVEIHVTTTVEIAATATTPAKKTVTVRDEIHGEIKTSSKMGTETTVKDESNVKEAETVNTATTTVLDVKPALSCSIGAYLVVAAIAVGAYLLWRSGLLKVAWATVKKMWL